MSTKTAFKRIALVAAAALAIGGFSAVSAQAAQSLTVTTGLVPYSGTNSTGYTGTQTVGQYAAFTVTGSADHTINITTSGVGSLYLPASAPTASQLSGGLWFAGASPAVPGANTFTGASSGTLSISAYSTVAGTQTLTFVGDVGGTTTVTLTWAAAPAFSAAYSTAINNNVADAAAASASSDDTLSADKAAVAGEIAVTIKNGSNTPFTGTTVSASVAGAGLISIDTTPSAATIGSAKVATSGALAGSVAYIHISGDGTAGVGTITVSVTSGSTTTTLATKTVTFTGAVAALKAVGNLSVLKAGGTTYAGTVTATDSNSVNLSTLTCGSNGLTQCVGKVALTVFATDANGNKSNAPANVKIVSSDSTVLTAGSCVAATGTDAVIGEYNCQVNGTALAASGKTATITAEASTDSGTTFTILATPVTFTIGGSIAAVSIATDAATYVAGSPLKIVATAKDSAGNLAYDQDAALFTSSGLTSSTVLGGATLPSSAVVTVINGVHTFSGFYAPVTSGSGTLTISGTDSTSAGNAVSATAALSDPSSDASNAATDAANEATDAANAATDAANAAADSADAATQAAQDASDQAAAALAAVTALSQQVTDLSAKIAALGASIAKITATLAKVASKVKA